MDNRAWNDYVDTFYSDGNNVKDMMLAQAGHMKQAGETYQESITGAGADQSAIINDILSQVKGGEGIYKPTTFMIGGEPVSFVNRGARNTGQFAMDAGQQDFINRGTTATGVLGASELTSPFAGDLAYLDKLSGLAGEEESRRVQDIFEKYRQDALDKGIAVDTQKLDLARDEADPSFLQKAGQVAEAGKGLFDLFSAGKSIFGF